MIMICACSRFSFAGCSPKASPPPSRRRAKAALATARLRRTGREGERLRRPSPVPFAELAAELVSVRVEGWRRQACRLTESTR